MRAWIVFSIIIIGAGLFFWDWNEDKLVRIDVPLENRDIHLVGEDLEDIKPLIEEIDWGTEVEPPEENADNEMVLFYEDDPNMPERLERLYIWYQKDGSAIAFNDYKEKYGLLGGASAEQLKIKFKIK